MLLICREWYNAFGEIAGGLPLRVLTALKMERFRPQVNLFPRDFPKTQGGGRFPPPPFPRKRGSERAANAVDPNPLSPNPPPRAGVIH